MSSDDEKERPVSKKNSRRPTVVMKNRMSQIQAPADGKRMSIAAVNFHIPTNQEADDFVHTTHGTNSWKSKTVDLLHSHKVQFLLMTLLLLDVLILFIEIFLLAHYPHCATIVRDCISCCEPNDVSGHDDDGEGHRFLAGKSYCEAGLEPNYYNEAGCDVHKYATVHKLEDVLFGITMSILGFFLLELNLEMVALGPCVFFRQFFYALDYVIILVSFVAEMALRLIGKDEVQALVGFLVFVRIWRFIRIGHGLVEVATDIAGLHYSDLMEYTVALEDELLDRNLPLPDAADKFLAATEEKRLRGH